MIQNERLRDRYDRLIVLNKEAHQDAAFSSAFYSLIAAYHCAETLHDHDLLLQVEHLCAVQLAVIDAHFPQSEYSSESAALHDCQSIYAQLAQKAHSKALLYWHPFRLS